MRYNSSIRSDLSAHREQQPGVKARAQRNIFGVYRPVTEGYADDLHKLLGEVKPVVDGYLSKKGKDGIEMHIPHDFGLTYVMHARVRRRIKNALQQGFSLDRATERIGEAVATRDDELEVYENGLGWYSFNSRTLAMQICGDDTETIKDENDTIEETLHELGMRRVSMGADHVTLLRVGMRHQKVELDRWHQHEISDIVQGRLAEADLGAIALTAINIGQGYRQPVVTI